MRRPIKREVLWCTRIERVDAHNISSGFIVADHEESFFSGAIDSGAAPNPLGSFPHDVKVMPALAFISFERTFALIGCVVEESLLAEPFLHHGRRSKLLVLHPENVLPQMVHGRGMTPVVAVGLALQRPKMGGQCEVRIPLQWGHSQNPPQIIVSGDIFLLLQDG